MTHAQNPNVFPHLADARQAKKLRASLRALAHEAQLALWRGNAGISQRTVLEAILAIASQARTLTVSCSVRQLAELAVMRKDTVTRALHALCDAGWLQLVKPGYGPFGAVYRIREPAPRGGRMTAAFSARAKARHAVKLPVMLAAVDRSTPDVFWRHGLGPLAPLALHVLELRPWCNAAAVASAIHANPRTTARLLAKLVGYGLAVHNGAGWSRGPRALDSLVELKTGVSQRQRDQHAHERREYLKRYQREARKRREATSRLALVPRPTLQQPEERTETV